MPEQFKVTPWDDERIKSWAVAIVPYTAQTINRIFGGVSIKEQGYNPSLAVLRLSKTYSEARLETACEIALGRGIRSPRYRHLKAILAANQDIVYKEQREALTEPEDTSMGYLRGSDYYRKGGQR